MNPPTVQLVDFESARSKLSPEDYRKSLDQVTLLGITLERLDAVADREAIVPGNSIRLQIFREFSAISAEPQSAGLVLAYTITGTVQKKRVVQIKATYRLDLASIAELSPEFISIYARFSADINVWPYLRELADSLTRRMNVPGLTLPLLKSPSVLNRRTK